MKTKFYKLGVSMLATMVMAVGVTQQASAGALATSVVTFENFQAFWQDTDTQVDAGDFSTLTYVSTADVSASLTSTGSSSDSGSSNNGAPLDLYETEGTVPGSYSDNDFDQISSAGGFPTGNFAIGDSNENGAPITGITGVNNNADLGNGSYVSLETGTDIGSATSNNGLTVSIIFTADRSDEIYFTFDLSTFVEAYLDIGEVADSFAQGTWDVGLKLEDITGGGFPLDFSLGCDASRTAPGGSTGTPTNGFGSGDCGAAGSFTAITGTLTDGVTYELTASIQTKADAKIVAIAVPEPSIIALMGLGMLALGGLNRRKHRLAA